MGEGRPKLMDKSTVLFVRIEASQYEALRWFAFADKRSIAAVTRDALSEYIDSRKAELPEASNG